MDTKKSGDESKQVTLRFYGTQKLAIVPIALYIVFAGIITIGLHFYGMEAMIFSAISALFVGFLLCKNKGEYWQACVRGIATFSNARLLIVFVIIGIFSTTLTTGDIGGGFVWISLQLGLHGGAFTLFAFLGSAFVAMGVGAPLPVTLTLVPLFYPVGTILGSDPGILVGAIISGVFFGDACTPGSQVIQTTIGSQHDAGTEKNANVVEVMKARTPYLVAIALVSGALFYFFGGTGGVAADPQQLDSMANPTGLLMLLPVALMLAICFKTRNLFLGVSWSILAAIVIGFISGLFKISDIVSIDAAQQHMGGIFSNGIAGSMSIVFCAMLLYGLIRVAIEGGTLQAACTYLLSLKMAQKPAGAEGIVAIGVGVVNALLSGAVLPAIIMFQEVADIIGKESGISANRRSILLTAMTTNITAVVPLNSKFIMGAITLVTGMAHANPALPLVNPFQIFAGCFYPLLLTLVCFAWVVLGWGRKAARSKAARPNVRSAPAAVAAPAPAIAAAAAIAPTSAIAAENAAIAAAAVAIAPTSAIAAVNLEARIFSGAKMRESA